MVVVSGGGEKKKSKTKSQKASNFTTSNFSETKKVILTSRRVRYIHVCMYTKRGQFP